MYPMQMVMRLSRYGAEFDNKKSPHNNLNLTIPSGMALVRVRYVAIRKLKTCSGSFRSRIGTLSKYVILNCWDRLPQKSSCVNVNLSGARPLHLAVARPFCRLKAPLGLSLLRCAAQTRTFENTTLSAACKKKMKTMAKRETGGLVLLICFLPAAPDRVPAPHPPARRKCPPGCDTHRPERPDLPLPGTR